MIMALEPFFRGRLIAIGGNEDKSDELIVLKRVVQEVGKTDYKVGIITTASEDPEKRGKNYHQVFKTLGASKIEILNIRERTQANDKKLAKTLEDSVKAYLKKSGIPVPNGQVVSTQEEAIAVFNEIGAPVVVKPDVGNHGNGSTINITDLDQLKKAFQTAQTYHPDVIVEEYVYGGDFRFLVIDGNFIAAARREPAHIIGDGKSAIKDLIQKVNSDPLRGFGHEKVLTQIEIDEMTVRLLSLRGLSLDSVPGAQEKIYLKATANLSQGGTATDVTDEVNPDIRMMAERTARIIGLDCVGVDALAKDISLPLGPSGIKVIEVNAAPGFRMHLEPTNGQARNVAKPLVDMLFPDGYTQTME
mgnify:FL=1